MTLLDLKTQIDRIITEHPEYSTMQLWRDGDELSNGDAKYSFHVEVAYEVNESSYLQPDYIMEDKTRFGAKYYTIKNKVLRVC